MVNSRFALGFFTKDIKISFRKFVTVTLLFANNLVWFYIFHSYLLDMLLRSPEIDLTYTFLGKMLFYSLAVVSGIIGSLISEKVQRRKFLLFWLILGLLTTASLAFFSGLEFSMLSSALLGISFGLGIPTCQAFLTESTVIEERGRIAGIVCFTTFTLVVLILLISQILAFGLLELVFVCVALKVASFLALIIDPCSREEGPIKPWITMIASRDFAYYLFPWLMFHLANGILLFGSFSSEFEHVMTMGRVFEYLGTIITALIAGFMADYFGRKWPILIGLVMLGVTYALFGLVASPETYFISMAVEGIAWGLVAVVYMQVVLGDLSSPFGSKERFYAVGGIVIPLFMFTVFSIVQEGTGITVPANTISSFLSIALLVSVIPVIRASETLPFSKIHARKLREHIEKVGKLVKESKQTEQNA